MGNKTYQERENSTLYMSKSREGENSEVESKTKGIKWALAKMTDI